MTDFRKISARPYSYSRAGCGFAAFGSLVVGLLIICWFGVSSGADAVTNNPTAKYVLAKRYARGDGLPQDYALAAELMRQAAGQGLAAAQNDLGALYARGLGVRRDFKEAAEWYRKAAEQGDALAQFSMGNIYSTGRGVPRDIDQAIQWWRKSAKQNQAQAENALGQHFFWTEATGTNLTPQPTNYVEAANWLRRAAEHGHVGAMNNLAYLYDHGFGVVADVSEAAKWYRTAAESGSAKAQGNYGLMCQDGRGAKKDPIEAYKWFKLSADLGDAIGVRYAREYVEKALLTAEEFAEATRRIAEFRTHAENSSNGTKVHSLISPSD